MKKDAQAVKLLPLLLSAKRRTWRLGDEMSAASDASFRKVERIVVERDGFTCQFCGFRDLHGYRSPRYIGVHHLDDDHGNNAEDNLATSCHPCHMCHHIGFAGMSGDYGMVWAPEFPQMVLNHLTRACFVALHYAAVLEQGQVPRGTREDVQAVAAAATGVMEELLRRREEARNIFQTDDLAELGNALLMMPEDAYAARRRVLGGLRLLPLGTLTRGGTDVMPKIVERWLAPKGTFAGMKPTSWGSLLVEAGRRIQAKGMR